MPLMPPGCAMKAISPSLPLRPFGEAPDLDVDFSASDRPALVSAVLARCCPLPDPDHWWQQPVGARTAALLHLVGVTDGASDLLMRSSCMDAACGAAFEFALPLAALPQAASVSDPVTIELSGGRTIRLRLPTGDDLRRWRAAHPASRAEAVGLMLATLLLEGDAGPADEAELSAALAELDPMVDFTVECPCPACGASNEVVLDLEALALSRLAARQTALLLQVHRCARHYGWTEAQVLAVPPARRARYLALIEDER